MSSMRAGPAGWGVACRELPAAPPSTGVPVREAPAAAASAGFSRSCSLASRAVRCLCTTPPRRSQIMSISLGARICVGKQPSAVRAASTAAEHCRALDRAGLVRWTTAQGCCTGLAQSRPSVRASRLPGGWRRRCLRAWPRCGTGRSRRGCRPPGPTDHPRASHTRLQNAHRLRQLFGPLPELAGRCPALQRIVAPAGGAHRLAQHTASPMHWPFFIAGRPSLSAAYTPAGHARAQAVVGPSAGRPLPGLGRPSSSVTHTPALHAQAQAGGLTSPVPPAILQRCITRLRGTHRLRQLVGPSPRPFSLVAYVLAWCLQAAILIFPGPSGHASGLHTRLQGAPLSVCSLPGVLRPRTLWAGVCMRHCTTGAHQS